MELVKLTNVGKTEILFNGNEKVVLKAGATKIVPWEFACNWLGDPALSGDDRALRYGYARLTWGYADGLDTAEDWEAKRPSVEVSDLETGDQIHMVLDDPTGQISFNGFGGLMAVDTDDTAILRAQLAESKARMDRLEALLMAQQNTATADLDPATLNALATTEAGGSTTELPKAKPTPAGASDGPKIK